MESKTLIFDQQSIEQHFQQAADRLFDPQQRYPVQYRDFAAGTFDACNGDLLSAVSGKNIVYALWAGPTTDALAVVYIGHVGSSQSRQRVRNHLCKKHKRTGAQLKRVEATLATQGAIGFSFVEVEPGYMRKALEEWLIHKYRKQLKWNKAGKREK
jgi:hypothetical protein